MDDPAYTCMHVTYIHGYTNTYTHAHIPIAQGDGNAIQDHHAERARVVSLDAILDVANGQRPQVVEELFWVLYVCMYMRVGAHASYMPIMNVSE
jgi:hypothetical protein